MTTSDESSLPTKVLAKFNVPNDVTPHFLVSNQVLHLTLIDFERNSDVLHLRHKRVLPQSVSILIVEFDSFLYRLWNADAILVGSLPILRLNFRDDTAFLLDGVFHPPRKCRLILDLIL